MTLASCSGDRFSRFLLQQVLDAVFGVAGLPAAAVELADRAAAHVASGLDGELDDVEQVHGDRGPRQHLLHGGLVDRAHVDGRDFHGVPPGRPGAVRPVRGVIRCAALDRSQQPLVPGQVVEAGVPPVGDQDILAGLLVLPPPGPAAAVLVHAQVSDRFRVIRQGRVRLLRERGVRGRPRHTVMPGCFRRGDAPLRDLVPAVPGTPPAVTQRYRNTKTALTIRSGMQSPELGQPQPSTLAPRLSRSYVIFLDGAYLPWSQHCGSKIFLATGIERPPSQRSFRSSEALLQGVTATSG